VRGRDTEILVPGTLASTQGGLCFQGYRIYCIETDPGPQAGYEKLAVAADSGASLFDQESVRNLCRRLLEEKDPAHFEELANRLHAVVSSNVDEIRLKLDYIARHYPELLAGEPSDRKPEAETKGKAWLSSYFVP
jgi:hypothetical protein